MIYIAALISSVYFSRSTIHGMIQWPSSSCCEYKDTILLILYRIRKIQQCMMTLAQCDVDSLVYRYHLIG